MSSVCESLNFGRSFRSPSTTVVVGDGAHQTNDIMAEALAQLGYSVRSLQLKTTDSSVPIAAARVAQRLKGELKLGHLIPSHVLVSSNAEHATAVVEGVLRLQLGGLIRLDGVVTVVDGPTASARLLTDQSVVPGASAPSLAIADRILVGRADLLTPEGLDGVAWALRNENRVGPISFPALAGVDIGALTEIDAWTGELDIGNAGQGLEDACATWQTIVSPCSDLSEVVQVVRRLLVRCAGSLLRVQGVIQLDGTRSVIVSGSGSTALTMASLSVADSRSTLSVVVPISRSEEVRQVIHSVFSVDETR